MVTDLLGVDVERGSHRNRIVAAAASALAVRKSNSPAGQIVRFVWHFIEMAIAMLIGMMPLGFVLSALGQSDLSNRSPEAFAMAMTASMVLPMAAWMRIRGHGWERTGEMTAAMTLPDLLLVVGSLAGLLPHAAALSAMDTLMWAGMLAAMLFRWSDYAQHQHGHGR